MKTILVAYDDSEPSRRALDRAGEARRGVRVAVLVASIARSSTSSPRTPTHARPGRPRRNVPRMCRGEETLVARGIDVEPIEATGDPASSIAKLADERSVDVVVIGSRGLGAVQRRWGRASARPCRGG